jgi:hypothetical protein
VIAGVSRGDLAPLIIGIICALLAMAQLLAGRAITKGIPCTKASNPTAFWCLVVWWFGMSAFFLFEFVYKLLTSKSLFSDFFS